MGPSTMAEAQGARQSTSVQAAAGSSATAHEYGHGKGRMLFTRRTLAEKIDPQGNGLSSVSNPKRRLIFESVPETGSGSKQPFEEFIKLNAQPTMTGKSTFIVFKL